VFPSGALSKLATLPSRSQARAGVFSTVLLLSRIPFIRARKMTAKKGKTDRALGPQVIRNAKARRDYLVEHTFEAGIALTGTEVKSIRAGKAQLSESFCRFSKGELFVYGLHIDEYAFGNINNHIPRRERKLLLKKSELRKIERALEAGGKSAVPIKMYFKQALIKLEIGLCVGKKLFDKREDLKKKAQMRDVDREMKSFRLR